MLFAYSDTQPGCTNGEGNAEPLDAIQDRSEQITLHRNRGHLECGMPQEASITRRSLLYFRGKMNQAETIADIAPWSALLHLPTC
jgi:hypothetical protein